MVLLLRCHCARKRAGFAICLAARGAVRVRVSSFTPFQLSGATMFRLMHVPTRTLLRSLYSTRDSALSFARFIAPHTSDQYVVVPAEGPRAGCYVLPIAQ